MKKLKIEMIHDVVCSWCHIGHHNISRALAAIQEPLEVEFQYLPYELNPDLAEDGVDIVSHLCERNQWTPADAANYRTSLLKTANDLGVVFDFEKRTHYYNTAKSHRLILTAQKRGLQIQMNNELRNAYHVEGKNMGDENVLAEIGRKVGLDADELNFAFNSKEATHHISLLQQRVAKFEVRTVPAFIFNDTIFVSGSNSIAFFKQFIDNILTSKSATGGS